MKWIKLIAVLAIQGSLLHTAFGFSSKSEKRPENVSEVRQQGQLLISVSNPMDKSREAETIEIPWAVLKKKISRAQAGQLIVELSGRQIPSQLIYNGRKSPQALIFQTDIPAKGTQQFTIKKGTPEAYPQKTYGRIVPERYDDFAWENDRVAFRMYGAPLDGRKENAKGIDIWLKRTSNLVINKWYKQNDYHVDHGEGVDAYHVGMTLGAGNSAPLTAEGLVFPLNYARYKILDQGPLRITFQLFYNPWKVSGRQVEQVKTITLNAGSNLNKITDEYKFKGTGLTIAAGVTKHKNDGTVLIDSSNRLVSYWDQADGKVDNGKVGVAVIIPGEEAVTFKDDLNHLLAIAALKRKQSFVYYQGGGWNRSGYFPNQDAWVNYLRFFSQKLNQPLTISYQ